MGASKRLPSLTDQELIAFDESLATETPSWIGRYEQIMAQLEDAEDQKRSCHSDDQVAVLSTYVDDAALDLLGR